MSDNTTRGNFEIWSAVTLIQSTPPSGLTQVNDLYLCLAGSCYSVLGLHLTVAQLHKAAIVIAPSGLLNVAGDNSLIYWYQLIQLKMVLHFFGSICSSSGQHKIVTELKCYPSVVVQDNQQLYGQTYRRGVLGILLLLVVYVAITETHFGQQITLIRSDYLIPRIFFISYFHENFNK